MIKTIIFDLGGVYFTDGTKQAVEKISHDYNINKDKVFEIFRYEIGSAYREGFITNDEFWEKARDSWGIDVPIQTLAPIWLGGYKPIKGTVDVIKRLKANEYQLLFLSDNVQERVDFLEEKYHFLQNFEKGVFSHIAGVRKPNPKIYELALKLSKNLAEDCVYIDDKSDLLIPAEKLGMKTIHFTSPETLEEELKKLGVKI